MRTALPTPRLTMLPERPSGGSPARGGGRTRNGAPSLADYQLHVAMTWVRRGYGVVPCRQAADPRRDKAAMVSGFGKNASLEDLAKFYDPEQVRRWFTRDFPGAHVALLTGRPAAGTRGLLVVDCDMRKPSTEMEGKFADAHGGTDVLEALARDAGAQCPETYEVLTPSGGLHLHLLQPDDGPLIGCAKGAGTRAPHIGPLIDVRGVGGYVIAPGSFSIAQGRAYTRVSAPGLGPQPIPPWLLAILRRPEPPRPAPRPVTVLPTGAAADKMERSAERALQRCAEKLAALRIGDDRRDRAFAYARWLGQISHTAPRVLTEQTVRDALLPAALACGVSTAQAEKNIRNGWARGITEPQSSLKALGGAA